MYMRVIHQTKFPKSVFWIHAPGTVLLGRRASSQRIGALATLLTCSTLPPWLPSPLGLPQSGSWLSPRSHLRWRPQSRPPGHPPHCSYPSAQTVLPGTWDMLDINGENLWWSNLVMAIDWAISSPSHSRRGHWPYGVVGLRAAQGFGLSHGAGSRTSSYLAPAYANTSLAGSARARRLK